MIGTIMSGSRGEPLIHTLKPEQCWKPEGLNGLSGEATIGNPATEQCRIV